MKINGLILESGQRKYCQGPSLSPGYSLLSSLPPRVFLWQSADKGEPKLAVRWSWSRLSVYSPAAFHISVFSPNLQRTLSALHLIYHLSKAWRKTGLYIFCGHRYSQRLEYTLNPFTSSPVTPVHVHVCFFGGVLFVQSVRVSACGCLSFYLNEGPCRCPGKLDLVKSQTEASVLTQSAGKGMW